MVKGICGTGHVALMLWRLYLRSRREWKSLLLQIVLPALITFCFQSPGLTIDYWDVTRSVKTFSAGSLVDPMALFGVVVDSPVFPPSGNFDINYVPFNWTGPPMLLWAPSNDAGAAAVMSNITQQPQPSPSPSPSPGPSPSPSRAAVMPNYTQPPVMSPNSTQPAIIDYSYGYSNADNANNSYGIGADTLLLKHSHVRSFPSESAMESWYLDNPGRVWAAVVFDKTPVFDTTPEGHLDTTPGGTDSSPAPNSPRSGPNKASWHYSIRINGSFTGTTKPSLQMVDEYNFASVSHNESKKYLWTGAALLQWTLDQAIARVSSARGGVSGEGVRSMGVPDYPQYRKNKLTQVDLDTWVCMQSGNLSGCDKKIQKDVQVLEFPFTDNKIRQLHWIFRFLNGFCINLGAFFSQTMLLTFLLREKESFLKFGLKSAGLSEGAYFTSIAIHQLAPVSLVSSALIPGVLYLDKVARFSSFPVLWVFFFLYLVAGNSFACFLSALVPSSKAAQNINSLKVFVVAAVYIAILSLGLGDAVKVPLCVVPSFAMHFIGDRMAVLEGENRGLTLATIWEPFPLTDTISCNLVLIAVLMVLSAVFWLLAAWYLSQVLPDHLGNRRPVCFPCACLFRGRDNPRVKAKVSRASVYASEIVETGDDHARADDRTAGVLHIRADDSTACVLRTNTGTSAKVRSTACVLRTNADTSADLLEHADTSAKATDLETGEGAGGKGISKRFKRSAGILCQEETIHAVRDLRLQVRQGEIFCLLGQNGAGKSTSVAMMTGQTPLSRGTIRYCLGVASHVDGESAGANAAGDGRAWERINVGVEGDSNAAVQRLRKHLGVCNQYDVLFSNLNALEHAFLFAALRRDNNGNKNGTGHGKATGDESEDHDSMKVIYAQVRALLKQAGLPPGDELKQVRNLSGGNRRKVSLAMALMGAPGLIFLDEPTAGMDPCSRRCVWEVVRDARDTGSAVVLTTHFLDEAECLGETVGIMKAGEMACCGSSLQLKRAYGDGLTITLTHTDPSPQNMEASVAALDAILMGRGAEITEGLEHPQPEDIRRVYPLTVSAGEINIGVPQACPPERLEQLLAHLEDSLERLQCSDLVLSTTTLERVFLNVAAGNQYRQPRPPNGTPHAKRATDPSNQRDEEGCGAGSAEVLFGGGEVSRANNSGKNGQEASPARCCVLRWLVVLTLFRIRFLEVLRARNALGAKIIIPLCFLVAAFIVGSLFTTDALIHSDPLRVDVESVLTGTDGSGRSGSVGAVSCADPWSIALMTPSNTTSAAAMPPNTYLDLAALARPGDGSGGSCAAPTVANYEYAQAFLDSIAPSSPSSDSRTSRGGASPIVGGFGYTNDGPLTSVSPSWADDAGFVHQTVGLAFNSSVVHSIPLLLNMYGRAMLRHTLGYTGREDAAANVDIVVDIHPLPYATLHTVDAAHLMLPMFLGSAFSSVSLSALTLVQQREAKVSHAMKLAGLSRVEFWLAQFLFDAAFGGVMVVAAVICVVVADATWFLGGARMGATIAVLSTSTLATAIMGYVLAMFFKQGDTATRILPLVIVMITVIPYVLLWILQGDEDVDTQKVGSTLAQILNVVPTIALQNGIAGIMTYSQKYPQGGGGGIWDPRHKVVQSIIANVGIVVLAVLVLVGSVVFAFFSGQKDKTQDGDKNNIELAEVTRSPTVKPLGPGEGAEREEDDDLVAAEILRARALAHGAQIRVSHARLNAGSTSETRPAADKSERNNPDDQGGGLVVSDLAKRYPGAMHRRALSGLSLVVPPRELMVLLGPNGAGKSTLMNILTGDIPLQAGSKGRQSGKRESAFTRGDVRVAGVNIAHGGTQVVFQNSLLGYCAQYDAVFEDITVAEHLDLYGKIRNAPSQVAAEGICKALGLHEYQRTAAGKLSGGNKRKLSLALGLLGNPRAVILDEPTTGVDAHAKRRVWKVLTQYHQQTGAAVMLSTHSMEEAQAVASRVAILTAGVLRCVGTARQLHVRYGFGYELEVELSLDSAQLNEDTNVARRRAMRDSKAAFSEFVTTTWPGATKTMEFNLRLIFQIPRGDERNECEAATATTRKALRVSAIIGTIGQIQDQFGVSDFSVSTTSLENVFQSFASKQSEYN